MFILTTLPSCFGLTSSFGSGLARARKYTSYGESHHPNIAISTSLTGPSSIGEPARAARSVIPTVYRARSPPNRHPDTAHVACRCNEASNVHD